MTGRPQHVAARMGRWSAKHRKLAILGWLAFIVLTIVLGGAVGTKELSDADAGIGESGRAVKIVAAAGFEHTDSESVIVQSKSLTSRSPQFRAALDDLSRRLSRTAGVENVRPPKTSKDGHSALVDFDYAGSDIEDALATAERVGRDHPALFIAEFGDASAEKALDDALGTDLHRAEYFSIPLTLVILLVAFGALVAAGIPLAVALSAVIATLGLLSVASQVFPADDAAESVILLIGLAVGVDYSLFYLRREREERAAGKGPEAALEAAAATSGRAVLLSGLTVLVAMAGMLLSGSKEIISVGIGAMIVVAVAVVGSLTVLPALLSKLGDRVERGRIPILHRLRNGTEPRIWGAVLERVLRRPVLAVLVAGAPLVALTAVAFQLHTVEPGFSSLPHSLGIVGTYERIQSAFPGRTEPAHVVVRAPDVESPAVRAGIDALRERAGSPNEVHVNPAHTVAVVSVPLPGKGTDEVSMNALAKLREEVVPATIGRVAGAEVAVGGTTAESKDFSDLLRVHSPIVFAFVLGLAFLLLLAAFRSLVIAVKAVLLNLLSVGAAYGLLVVVFQHGVGESLLDFQSNGGVVSWLPLFLFVVLFGLSMDYHVFILARIREAVDGGLATEEAVARSIKATAGTVTSAAVVMVAVFAVFGTLSQIEMKQLGVGLASAILIDATIVRAVLLPATMKLLGKWNWYLPRWLEWMPRLSVEAARS